MTTTPEAAEIADVTEIADDVIAYKPTSDEPGLWEHRDVLKLVMALRASEQKCAGLEANVIIWRNTAECSERALDVAEQKCAAMVIERDEYNYLAALHKERSGDLEAALFIERTASSVLAEKVAKLEAGQRTPGTVEVCKLDYRHGTMGCERNLARAQKNCKFHDCPIRAAAKGVG